MESKEVVVGRVDRLETNTPAEGRSKSLLFSNHLAKWT
jgi:hypothetical protein